MHVDQDHSASLLLGIQESGACSRNGRNLALHPPARHVSKSEQSSPAMSCHIWILQENDPATGQQLWACMAGVVKCSV